MTLPPSKKHSSNSGKAKGYSYADPERSLFKERAETIRKEYASSEVETGRTLIRLRYSPITQETVETV